MQVQDVLTNVSTDVRSVILPSATFITWVDRIQKDALHTSTYNYLLKQMATFNVVQGTSSYTIATTGTPRRLTLVYDRTFDRLLVPVENLWVPASKTEDSPTGQPAMIPKPMLSAATSEQWPEYYYQQAATGNNIALILFPAPQKTAFNGTYEAYYEIVVPDLLNLTDTLILPNDAMPLVVAGVNSYASAYLKLDQEAMFWKQEYETLKKGVIAS